MGEDGVEEEPLFIALVHSCFASVAFTSFMGDDMDRKRGVLPPITFSLVGRKMVWGGRDRFLEAFFAALLLMAPGAAWIPQLGFELKVGDIRLTKEEERGVMRTGPADKGALGDFWQSTGIFGI